RAADEEGLALGDSLALLAAYGIDIVPSRLVATADAAAQAAEEIGFPAVLKLARRRSDQYRPAGAIALDLPDAESVRAAMLVITARLRRRGDWPPAAEFLVQQQIGRSRELRIRVAEDPVLGPIIGFGPGGGDQSDVSALAVDLPPLNLTLARSLIARSSMAARLGAIRGFNAADFDEIAGCLVRVSQLIIDFPDIAAIDLDPIFADEHGIKVGGARIRLRPAGSERPSLVITPYPADMITTFTAKGRTFTLRPIRPEDAQAHGALFSRVSPEDIRYRFFSAMRQLSAEQTARMTQVDYMREMAIIAVDEQTGFTCGVARLVRGDTDGTEGEFAVLVDPGAKGLGLATTLMRALIAWGDRQGVSEIIGQILADNHPMIAFARSLGFAIRHPPGEDDIVEARLAL
ncbi:MAG TPA: GNAT family N-acetyltransferase, partial [Acetobacteraceae bacterium]|nr:GNAT family N-acetyltransferase [Acetobacteraceae bacterium]